MYFIEYCPLKKKMLSVLPNRQISRAPILGSTPIYSEQASYRLRISTSSSETSFSARSGTSVPADPRIDLCSRPLPLGHRRRLESYQYRRLILTGCRQNPSTPTPTPPSPPPVSGRSVRGGRRTTLPAISTRYT